ncbi:protein of unknown function [Streptococcus thermophilus]|nr:protein of unknown function [Streptococcus thermophilus]
MPYRLAIPQNTLIILQKNQESVNTFLNFFQKNNRHNRLLGVRRFHHISDLR